jgi:hypothetical protein
LKKLSKKLLFVGFLLATVACYLHFSVKAKLNFNMDAYVKTKFNTSKGEIFLETGNLYGKPNQ